MVCGVIYSPPLHYCLQISLLTNGPSKTSNTTLNIEISLEEETTGLDINTVEQYRVTVVREGDRVDVRWELQN